jgi:hypothetical protein
VRKNKKGISSGLRGLIENIGAITWISEESQRAQNLVKFQSVKVGKLVNKGILRYPELKDKYEEYSEFFHPARSGHLIDVPGLTENELAVKFAFDFSDWFIEEFSKDMVRFGLIILSELKSSEEKYIEIVRHGKVMVRFFNSKTGEYIE